MVVDKRLMVDLHCSQAVDGWLSKVVDLSHTQRERETGVLGRKLSRFSRLDSKMEALWRSWWDPTEASEVGEGGRFGC